MLSELIESESMEISQHTYRQNFYLLHYLFLKSIKDNSNYAIIFMFIFLRRVIIFVSIFTFQIMNSCIPFLPPSDTENFYCTNYNRYLRGYAFIYVLVVCYTHFIKNINIQILSSYIFIKFTENLAK